MYMRETGERNSKRLTLSNSALTRCWKRRKEMSFEKYYERELKGCSQKDIVDDSREVAGFNKDRVYIFTRGLIRKLRKDKYTIIAISGSPIEIVKEYNKYLKFDEVFGSVYETDGRSIYTGKTIFEPVKHKGHLVGQYISEKNLSLDDSYGVGDTESDVGFLKM